jgi:transcriptional regulator
MYQPPHHREDRRDVLFDLIRSHPLATIVTVGEDGPEANHVPMLIDAGGGAMGVLRAHVARGNELALLPEEGVRGLAIFQGVEHYITPSWYATKRETGKVVPTWNYVVVHAHGRLRPIPDHGWLRQQLDDLTDHFESGRREPWRVSDAPEDFRNAQMKGIIGLELEIDRLEGKWKISQNRTAADRAGVVAGLHEEEGEGSPMAFLVERVGK